MREVLHAPLFETKSEKLSVPGVRKETKDCANHERRDFEPLLCCDAIKRERKQYRAGSGSAQTDWSSKETNQYFSKEFFYQLPRLDDRSA